MSTEVEHSFNIIDGSPVRPWAQINGLKTEIRLPQSNKPHFLQFNHSEPENVEPENKEPENVEPGSEEPENKEPENKESENVEPGSEEPENVEPGGEEPREEVLMDLIPRLSGIKSLDDIRIKGTGSRPNRLEVDSDGSRLLDYLGTRGIMGDQIKAYEQFIFKQIPIIIKQRKISLGDGTHAVFTNSHLVLPHLQGFSGEPKVLFPQTARERGLTYSFQLRVDLERRRDLTGEIVVDRNCPQVIRGLDVGKIPAMLGSSVDNLQAHRILGQDLLKLGECPHDPRGYFIVSGVERAVAMQERLRTNKILMYENKQYGKVCKMTCLTTRGSTIVKLFKKGKDESIRLGLQIFKGDRNNISVIQAFQILGIPKISDVVEYILEFVKDEWKGKVLLALQGSVMAANEISDPYQDAYHKSIYVRSTTKGRRGSNKKNVKLLTDQHEINQLVYSEVVNSLFTQIDMRQAINREDQMKLIKSKKILLGMMTARYAEFSVGLRKPTDRDSWINKRLNTSGRLMEQLFRRLWDSLINEIENGLASQGVRTLETVKQKIKSSIITDSMVSSFTPNKWGPINMTKDKNVVEAVDREESALSIFDQLLRINTPTNRKSNQARARGVQESQFKYICVVSTPSGDACGLVKNKSILCWVSVQNDSIPTHKYLGDHIVADLTIDCPDLCILNGVPLGWCDGPKLRSIMVQHRRRLEIPFDAALIYEDQVLYVYTNGSRPTSPFLVVGDDGIPLMESLGLEDKNFHELMICGAVEYLDVWEAVRHGVVACSLDRLNTERETKQKYLHLKTKIPELLAKVDISKERKAELKQILESARKDYQRIIRKAPYTHVEIDANGILGITASVIPFIGSNPGPRNNFQCNMSRQSLGITTSNPSCRYPTTGKSLVSPAPALVITQLQDFFGLDNLPAGSNIILAIRTHPNNEEDAIVIKKEALDRGLFTYVVVHSYTTVISDPIKISNGEIVEYVSKPTKPAPSHTIDQYEHLDENGIIRINSVVKVGDCLVHKTRKITTHPKGSSSHLSRTVKEEDTSIYVEIWGDGIVDSVLFSTNLAGEKIIKVRIRATGRPMDGDKMANRGAQKSTIGKVINASEMPFTKEGVIPDIYINPHALPKRMTISTYLEIVSGKYAALSGTRVNASAFKSFSIDIYSELLETLYGYDGSGAEILYNYSGDLQTETEIEIGPSQYQLLKHQVHQKHQCRGEGPKTMQTRQATKGRKRGGAVRLGEQETAGLIAHGASHMLRDRTFTMCDPHYDVVCKNCRTIAISNCSKGILICQSCNGNDFVIFEHPYTLTVLTYYAAATGINITPFLKVNPSDQILINDDLQFDENYSSDEYDE